LIAFSSPTNAFLTALKWLDTFEILFIAGIVPNLHISVFAGCSNRFFFIEKHMSSIHFVKMIEWKVMVYWMSLVLSVTNGEIFTSLTQMKGLVRLENALSKSLDSYLEQRSEAPGVIRQFADHVRKERKIAAGDIEKYVFHPINSFQLVRRFIRHWTELESYLARQSPNGKTKPTCFKLKNSTARGKLNCKLNIGSVVTPIYPIANLQLFFTKG